MLKGLRTAETAMNIQLTRTNALANNLANVNTTGFKRMLTQVVEDMGPGAAAGGAAPSRQSADTGYEIPRDLILKVRAPIDNSQGPLQETGNPLDFAIKGKGMFKVKRDGKDYYTRNGSFNVDQNRQIVTSSGDIVLGAGGPIELPNGEIMVRQDGTILVDDIEVTRLSLTFFDDPGKLGHIGDSLMSAPDDITSQAVPVEDVEIIQGMLEGSNVNPIDTLIGMIAAQRAFEMQAKILSAADRTLDKSVNQLSSRA